MSVSIKEYDNDDDDDDDEILAITVKITKNIAHNCCTNRPIYITAAAAVTSHRCQEAYDTDRLCGSPWTEKL